MWGDILSTEGDVQYRGEYHDSCGGYHEYCGGVQYNGGYHPLKFEYRGGYHDTCGGYHEGCSVSWGTQITKDFSPHGTEHPPRYS